MHMDPLITQPFWLSCCSGQQTQASLSIWQAFKNPSLQISSWSQNIPRTLNYKKTVWLFKWFIFTRHIVKLFPTLRSARAYSIVMKLAQPNRFTSVEPMFYLALITISPVPLNLHSLCYSCCFTSFLHIVPCRTHLRWPDRRAGWSSLFHLAGSGDDWVFSDLYWCCWRMCRTVWQSPESSSSSQPSSLKQRGKHGSVEASRDHLWAW